MRAVAPVVACLLTAGCAAAEQVMLERYFSVARLRDTTELSGMAVVLFDPHTEGIVRKLRVTAVGAETTRPLTHDRDTAASEGPAGDRAATATPPDSDSGEKRPFDKAPSISEPRRLTEESPEPSPTPPGTGAPPIADERVARISLGEQHAPGAAAGELRSRQVTIAATIQRPTGERVEKALGVTLERAVLSGAAGAVRGGWVVTAVREQDTGRLVAHPF